MDEQTQNIETCSLTEGQVLKERFKIQSLIGTGGMGAVYLAFDEFEQKNVALKILHSEHYSDKELLHRFLQEVEFMKSIDHENVVKTHDVYVDQGIVFYSMEYLPGNTLTDLIKSKSLTIQNITDIALDICNGLSAIHAIDIVHRDIKPSNILVSEGKAKICDFGVARLGQSTLTQKGMQLGFACYIAPETWTGKGVTSKSDLYSLGILLYETLTGILPFSGSSVKEIMFKHLQDEPDSISNFNPQTPEWLCKLVSKLLEKDPGQRPENTYEVINTISQNTKKDFVAESTSSKSFNTENTVNNLLKSNKKIPSVLGHLSKNLSVSNHLTRPISVPKDSARRFKIKPPGRDVIYFGFLLCSLHLADWVLTSKGIGLLGIGAEANPVFLTLFQYLHYNLVLGVSKVIAIVIVISVSIVSQYTPYIRTVLSLLSSIYLLSAIFPWLCILYYFCPITRSF